MELAVKDKSGRVNLTTTWRELSIPQSSGNYLPLFPMITHISTRYLKPKLMLSAADQDGDGDPPPRDKMFSTLVSIRGLLKFLTSHVISGTTIACELSLDWNVVAIRPRRYRRER